jgi:hypothetical protein
MDLSSSAKSLLLSRNRFSLHHGRRSSSVHLLLLLHLEHAKPLLHLHLLVPFVLKFTPSVSDLGILTALPQAVSNGVEHHVRANTGAAEATAIPISISPHGRSDDDGGAGSYDRGLLDHGARRSGTGGRCARHGASTGTATAASSDNSGGPTHVTKIGRGSSEGRIGRQDTSEEVGRSEGGGCEALSIVALSSLGIERRGNTRRTAHRRERADRSNAKSDGCERVLACHCYEYWWTNGE